MYSFYTLKKRGVLFAHILTMALEYAGHGCVYPLARDDGGRYAIPIDLSKLSSEIIIEMLLGAYGCEDPSNVGHQDKFNIFKC